MPDGRHARPKYRNIDNDPMTYQEAVDFLNGNFVSFQTAGRTAYKGGLEAIAAMCRAMGEPQRDYLSIHIAGTNGKGSVPHMLASILQSAGYRTGLYTSPHLHDFRERIRVDGRMIPEAAVASLLDRYGQEMVDRGLSYFEMTTAMAFRHFSEAGVEVAVVETGLGGRLDATNILRPALSIITNIGLDHSDLLGSTVAQIAAEKAGIIKPGVPVLIGESDPESAPVFTARAAECGAPLTFADRVYECTESTLSLPLQSCTLRRIGDDSLRTITLDLPGAYQRKNLVTVRTAVDLLCRHTQLAVSRRALLDGCRHVTAATGLSGRWQVVDQAPLTVADGGHNPHGIKEIVSQLQTGEYDRLYMILGFSADKGLEEILPLLPTGAYYLFTQANSPRALSAGELAAQAARYGLTGETVPDAATALARARSLASPRDMIFIGGSFYLIGEIV